MIELFKKKKLYLSSFSIIQHIKLAKLYSKTKLSFMIEPNNSISALKNNLM
jgi:hypothetical protein